MDTEAATILHLSDLHFGTAWQHEIWESFIEHVKTMEPLPKVAIVTGDVVDTPKKKYFDSARKGLLKLSHALGGQGTEYSQNVFVCPGNHDRHPWGNRIFLSEWWSRHKLYLYNDKIGRRNVTELFESRIESAPTNRWKLWVAQVDTSRYARVSAQGFVTGDDIEEIKRLAEKGHDPTMPFSLVILMMHHHVLPIASLERKRPTYSGIFSFTTGTNPGHVLQSLSEGHVDLVLHGHMHKSHAARYGLYGDNIGEIAVVGAGSTTGMVTSKGCFHDRASFNVIELRPDRSVWLNVFEGDFEDLKPVWALNPRATIRLLDSTTVRRNRFVRLIKQRNKARNIANAPTAPTTAGYSEWQRHVSLTAHRDAIVEDRKTNWFIDNGRYSFEIANETGWPTQPGGRFFPKASPGIPIEFTVEDFDRVPGSSAGTFAFVGNCPPEVRETEAERIETSFVWTDAVLLTQDDVRLLANGGEIRGEGLEFIGAHVDAPIASLTLTVTFPAYYCPELSAVSVYVKNTMEPKSSFGQDVALGSRLQKAGQTLVLNVPYPMIDYTYAIVWRPVEEPISDEANQQKITLIERLRENKAGLGERLVQAAMAVFPESWRSHLTVSLYIADLRSPDRSVHLERVGRVLRCLPVGAAASAAHEFPAATIKLEINGNSNLPHLFRTAWWGEPGSVGRDGPDDSDALDAGLMRHEEMALAIPIWRGEHNGHPVAIFRIGLSEATTEGRNLPDKEEFLRRAIERVEVAVLHELGNAG